MASEKIDLYALSQQDYYVLEDVVKENPKILTHKDDVRILYFQINLSFLFHHIYLTERTPYSSLGSPRGT